MKKEVNLFLLVLVLGIFLVGNASAITKTVVGDTVITGDLGVKVFSFNDSMNETSFSVKWKATNLCVDSKCSGIQVTLNSPSGPIGSSKSWYFIDDNINSRTLDLGNVPSGIYNSISISIVTVNQNDGTLALQIPVGFNPSVTLFYLNVTGTVLTCANNPPTPTSVCGTYPDCAVCTCANKYPTTTPCGTYPNNCIVCPAGSQSTSTDQTMFRLYQNTNSHAAIWNISDYPIQVNYSDIFSGTTYSSASDPHVCTSINTPIFWLNAINNSHVSVNQIVGSYDIPVCYGNLNCINSLSPCSGDYRNVSRLYQNNNSHISNASDTNYPVFICCKLGTTTSSFSGNLKWKKMNDVETSTAQVNDDVVLLFGQGNVAYSIRNETSEILSGFSTENFTIWKARAGNYTFNITNSSGIFYSLPLNVSATEVDSAPSGVRISSPIDRSTYKVGSHISFNQTTSDEDDLLNLIWDLGNTSKNTIVNYSLFEKNFRLSTSGDFITSYSNPGVYNIELFADEASRDKFGSNYTSVIVLKTGINVVPIITMPVRGITLPNKTVVFNASETYVVNCVACSGALCGSGDRVGGFYTTDTLLNCSYVHAPLSRRGLDLPANYNLTFTWTLDPGSADQTIFTNKWTSKTYFSIVEFIYNFQEARKHFAKLEVTYS